MNRLSNRGSAVERARDRTPAAWRVLVAGVGALTLLGASACGGSGAQEPAAPDAAEIRDYTNPDGTTVQIPVAPQRVITLGQATPSALELGIPLVGVSEADTTLIAPDALTSYEELPKVGQRTEINIEEIATLAPDLIISGIPSKMEFDYTALTEIAPVVVAEPGNPGEWRTTNETIADAAGVQDTVARMAQDYDARTAELNETYGEKLEGVSAASIAAGFEKNQWQFDYQDSWSTSVIQDAGLRFDQAAEDGGFFETLSFEELDRLDDYDLVVIPGDGTGEPTELIRPVLEQSVWQELEPVEAGRVYTVAWPEALTYTTAMLRLDALEKDLLSKL
ncbi:ABC transporter substrate-binding protein [Nocardiopsis ansamitocini]|uniref:ABC transporter substrate-binding protein n=1 Tax=Nocardiopsis ansamitocini TaxID=1670832 RepID=A0A9W6P8F4_9ACTN|nr:ABC transporter substrate-binding protein [Nocardiopsis ansamitocini]GLU48913.1 ABC transporter substrate-binding protein [Nocardiopsis ansamitocini]